MISSILKTSHLHVIIFLFLLPFGTNAQQNSIDTSRETIRKMVEELGIVGLAVTVSIKNEIVWSEGFGYSDLDKTKRIDPAETHFRIASISKPIAATIMGRLWEEGIIDIDKSLYDYTPNFPKKEYDFTLRHLANHRSGIRHYKFLEKENTEPLTIEEGLVKFEKSKLGFEPGSQYLYSSYGYNLLGVAMEKASGESYERLLVKYVTEPLEMDHTKPDNANYEGLNTSGFFDSNGKGKVKESKPVNLYMKMPSGGILSTSEDLVRLGNAYAYGKILKDKTRNEMLQNVPLPNGTVVNYALGWGVATDKKGRTLWSHTGGNTGSVCRLIIYPEQKFTIAIVSNTFGVDYLRFIRTMANISEQFLTEIEN